MYKKIVIIAAVLLTSACASTAPEPSVIIDTPVYHPVRPDPYKVCAVYWNYFDWGGKAMKAITFDGGIELEKCMRDKNRYMEQLNQVVCQYRQELNEPMCNKG